MDTVGCVWQSLPRWKSVRSPELCESLSARVQEKDLWIPQLQLLKVFWSSLGMIQPASKVLILSRYERNNIVRESKHWSKKWRNSLCCKCSKFGLTGPWIPNPRPYFPHQVGTDFFRKFISTLAHLWSCDLLVKIWKRRIRLVVYDSDSIVLSNEKCFLVQVSVLY